MNNPTYTFSRPTLSTSFKNITMKGWIMRCTVLASALSIVLLSMAVAGPADASVRKSTSIPAESLDLALRTLAKDRHLQVLYRAELVQDVRTPGASGSLTSDEAFSKVLTGTGLSYKYLDAQTVTIVSRESAGSPDSPRSDQSQTADDQSKEVGKKASQDFRVAQVVSGTPGPPAVGGDQNAGKEEALSEIIVTGTNITGVDNKTVPLLSFDKEAIERSGYASIADFITALPQNVKSGTNSADGILSGVTGRFNNIENSTAANLRGLGSNSTLTLINGHRVAASSFGTGVDLSMIPVGAVERIDVLTDGSSAVYGSDAVGGVVNIVLRKDYNGAETHARLDTLSRGGGEINQVGQTVGKTWSTGSALAVLQFEEANPLRADQRTFTSPLAQPTDVLPESKRYSGVLSANQSIGGSLELFADAVLEHQTGFRYVTAPGALHEEQAISNKTNSSSVNTGFRWQTFGDWHFEANVLFSQVDTLTIENFTPADPDYVNGTPYVNAIDTIKEGDLKFDGTVWSAGGSSLKAAVGASYREEDFSALLVFNQPLSRHVHAAFVEFYAPLITNVNAIPFVKKLELSAAVRDDSYSDFGSKINPRFGIFWSPDDQLGLRVAYSTSFRAPTPTELFDAASANTVLIESGFPQPGDPNGNASVIFFGNQTLHPETSKNLSAGLDFAPTLLPSTRFSLNYYRITYSNRIIIPPFSPTIFLNQQTYGPLIRQFPNDTAVEAFVAALEPPQQLFDFTNGQTGLAGVRYGYTYGAVNATRQNTQGLDFGALSTIALSSTDKLNLEFNATYIRDLQTTFCDTCLTTNLVNTYGEPLKLRLRAGAGWTHGPVTVASAINYANAYSDTNLTPPGHIAAFATLDLHAGWLIRASGTTLTLNILNAFNSNPPRTAPAFDAINYDPTNADPRGRTLSLQVKQTW
jgi:iron complex outermembrane receptor protein